MSNATETVKNDNDHAAAPQVVTSRTPQQRVAALMSSLKPVVEADDASKILLTKRDNAAKAALSALYEFVYNADNDEALTGYLNAECDTKGINVPSNVNEGNFIYAWVRAFDGEYVDEPQRDGSAPVQKWKSNRNYEMLSYAALGAFRMNLTPTALKKALKENEVLTDTTGKTFRAAPVALKDADSRMRKFGRGEGEVIWTQSDQEDAISIKPLAVVELDKHRVSAFTLHEGYAVALVRIEDGRLEVLGDVSGKSASVLKTVVSKRKALRDRFDAVAKAEQAEKIVLSATAEEAVEEE